MLSSILSVPRPCEETVRWLQQRLLQDGLRALQTFDLQDARLSLEECPCPHHGTEDCDCQMVIVLVYGRAAEPATLFLHGYDGQTWISLADRPERPADTRLVAAIERALSADRPATAELPA